MNLVWFRRDLRVDDNSALLAAINTNKPVVALFVATPSTWQQHELAPIQADFIYRRLFELQQDLANLNIPLLYAEVVSFSDSADKVAELADELGCEDVYLNKEYELNEVRRDERLAQVLSTQDKALHCFDDKCILNPGTVVNKQNQYFKVFTPFKKAYLSQLSLAPVVPQKAVEAVLPPESLHTSEYQFSQDSMFSYPRVSSEDYAVDTESIYQTLRRFNSEDVDDYKDKRDFPAIEGTSRLSPYLAIGALSVRQCMARVLYQQSMPLSAGRETWQSELIWREFYQHLIYFEPKLSMGKSFLEWGEQLRWDNSQTRIEAWKTGNTGYPIVDAAMKQLNQTGWMHNRLRMIVASFLIKDLQVDWRVGEAYFMSKLIDGDYPANNGGWQWCASTGCDGQPYFRIFNPVTQGERFDADGSFVRRWIPELASVPDKYVHQPWKWSNVSALSYPSPIVDHKAQREITLLNYKNAKDTLDAT